MVVAVEMAIVGDMMLYSLLEVYVFFPSILKIGAVCSFKTFMNFYQTTWHHIQRTDLVYLPQNRYQ